MKTFLSTIALLLSLGLTAGAADGGKTPKMGDKAPLVEGKDQDGKTWKLADHVGKQVVLLYFYPKDDTPGCTKQSKFILTADTSTCTLI